MNLIEQLGGYEKAKGYLEKHPFKIYSCKDTLDKISLSNALLQHRRENNIFEVGDKVVLVGYWYADTVWTVTTENKDMVSLISDNIPGFSSVIISIVRHATGKEIEQGYRDE